MRNHSLGAIILAAILVASCSVTMSSPIPGTTTPGATAPAAGPTQASTAAPGATATAVGPSQAPTASAASAIPTEGTAVGPTPPIVDGRGDPTALTPPILEEGDVPPAEETTPITGHLSVGAAADLASQTIGTAGGTIEANGLRLEVAPETLAADTPFSVTETPISAADFGGAVTPLTPLYTVETGGAALAAPITVTLPATIPDGTTAMGFSYDDAAGTLTPLVPISQDGASITVGATHFSSLFGALIDWAKVPTTVDSGFRPGQDDWQFTNYGSYVAPGGHCEGQSVTAIWYYVIQRRKGGASPLYGTYDNNGAPAKTPILWQDDSDGYRLASTVQNDPLAVEFTYEFLKNAMWDSADGRLTYEAFRAAIAFSGEPQLVRLGGHTMIVYRVTPDRLFVADPNYPAKLRTIRYDAATGTLGPYSSGANAADIAEHGATIYTRLAYVPWRSSSSEAALAAHWAEFETNKAGDGVFPKYALEAMAGVDDTGTETWVPLVDGYQSTQKQLKIRLRDPSNVDDVAIEVFPGTSSTPLAGWNSTQTVELKDGNNDLGILVDFSRPADTKWRYVDFVRVGVTLVGATVELSNIPDACPLTDTEYTFQASARGIPTSVKRVGFTWDVGAGPVPGQTFEAPYADPLVSEITQTFTTEGSANLVVILSDLTGTSPIELARAQASLQVYKEKSMDWTLCNHQVEP